MSEDSLNISEDHTHQRPLIDPNTGAPKQQDRCIRSILVVTGVFLIGLGICLLITGILSTLYFKDQLKELGLTKVTAFNEIFLDGTFTDDIDHNSNAFDFLQEDYGLVWPGRWNITAEHTLIDND